ncbi:hypothetical protein LQW54_002508 [Pestalotiopsis sp. IQ-011]
MPFYIPEQADVQHQEDELSRLEALAEYQRCLAQIEAAHKAALAREGISEWEPEATAILLRQMTLEGTYSRLDAQEEPQPQYQPSPYQQNSYRQNDDSEDDDSEDDDSEDEDDDHEVDHSEVNYYAGDHYEDDYYEDDYYEDDDYESEYSEDDSGGYGQYQQHHQQQYPQQQYPQQQQHDTYYQGDQHHRGGYY